MSMSKRFISGAVCPTCREVDRIVIEPVAADETNAQRLDDLATENIQRRCVSCGFVEPLDPERATTSAPLPRARYERSRETTTRVTPVKILDPGNPKSS